MTSFVTETLSREHDRTVFRSGVDVLGRYPREFALQDMRRRVAAAAELAMKTNSGAVLLVVAADHLIPDTEEFTAACRAALPAAMAGSIVIAVPVNGPMVGAAERNGEFIADPAPHGSRLHEPQMVSV